MKLIAITQFYLGYVLPRALDWEGNGVTIRLPDVLAKVSPRGVNESLFPSDVDETLATMQIQFNRVSLPVSETSHIVRDICHDRVQVTVEGEANPGESPTEIEKRFLDAAVGATNVFLGHCRVAAKAPFVLGIEEHYRLEDGRRYVLTPRTTSWFSGETGEGFPMYDTGQGKVNANAASGAIRSPERGSISMAEIHQSLRASPAPNLARSLLIDATEWVVTMRLRESILSLATACEVASNQYLSRHGSANDPAVKAILRQNASFSEKRLHLIPQHVSGLSLKLVDTTTFDLVEQLYRARNNVIHEAVAQFSEGPHIVQVDLPQATRFLSGVTTAVEWLDSQ
jgi:hypothetical protein